MSAPNFTVEREEIYEVEVKVIRETERSYLFEDIEWSQLASHDGDAEAFFPKSQVHFARRNVKTGLAAAMIPGWLLIEKGWRSQVT